MEVDSWNCHHQRNHCHQHRHHRHYRNHYHCHLCHHHRHRQYLGLFREVSNGSGQLECHSCPIVSTLPRAESSFHHCCWSVVQIHKYTNTQNTRIRENKNTQIHKYAANTQQLLKMPPKAESHFHHCCWWSAVPLKYHQHHPNPNHPSFQPTNWKLLTVIFGNLAVKALCLGGSHYLLIIAWHQKQLIFTSKGSPPISKRPKDDIVYFKPLYMTTIFHISATKVDVLF